MNYGFISLIVSGTLKISLVVHGLRVYFKIGHFIVFFWKFPFGQLSNFVFSYFNCFNMILFQWCTKFDIISKLSFLFFFNTQWWRVCGSLSPIFQNLSQTQTKRRLVQTTESNMGTLPQQWGRHQSTLRPRNLQAISIYTRLWLLSRTQKLGRPSWSILSKAKTIACTEFCPKVE